MLLNIIGLAVSLLSILAFSWVTQILRDDFNIWRSLGRFGSFPGSFLLFAQLLSLSAVYIILHEKFHQWCFRAFGIKTTLHLRTWKPRVTIPDGAACSKYKALAAILAPLVVLGAAALLSLLIGPVNYLYLAVFLISTNIGASSADVSQALWLLKYPGSYIFGSEKQGAVLWGP